MQKRYKFIGIRGVGSFKDITLGWKRKSEFTVQSNGKVSLGNCGRYGILESRRKMMAFRTIRNKFHIPRGYGYIWQSILVLPTLVFPIPKLVVKDPWKDWSFGIGKSIFVVHTNKVYHKLVQDRAWLTKRFWIYGTLLNM